jgi:hypothetical protein
MTFEEFLAGLDATAQLAPRATTAEGAGLPPSDSFESFLEALDASGPTASDIARSTAKFPTAFDRPEPDSPF